jgi:hypothetical protein
MPRIRVAPALLPRSWDVGMFVVRLFVGVMWVLAAVAGHEMWTPRANAVHHPPPSRGDTTAISIPIARDESDRESLRAQPRVDIYGNPIDEAIGDYRVDPQGDVYEWHSPETALLKLGAPGV